MTTYNLTSNIRSGSASGSQNVTVGDTVVVTILTAYTPNVGTLVNCSATRVVSSGSSSSSSTVFTVVPTSSGTYSAILNQPYYSRTYTLTGTASAAGGGGSSGGGGSTETHGFKQFDASGNLVLDSSAAVKTFVVYEQARSIYVNAPYSGSTSYTDVTVPGVTSQQDLDDNYVFIRRDGGAFSIWGADTTHGYAYQSANTVRFTWRGTCETFNIGGGSSCRACNIYDAHTQQFDIIILGKDLS